MGVDLDVQDLRGSGAELLQDAVHGLGDVVRHGLGELHLAVDDHAALPEVQDLQLLEARQVGLQVRQQLEAEEKHLSALCTFTWWTLTPSANQLTRVEVATPQRQACAGVCGAHTSVSGRIM